MSRVKLVPTGRIELMSVPAESHSEIFDRAPGPRRVLPLVVVAVALAFVFVSGLYRELSLEALVRHHAAIAQAVADHPAAAFAGYVGLYIAVVALSIPGALFLTVAGGVVFGTLFGAVGAIIGATVGATIIFLIARGAVGATLVGRAGPTFEKLAAGFRKDAFCYLLFLRLVPLFPLWLINLVPALAGVRLKPYVGATVIGIIPGSFAFAFFGSGIESMFEAKIAAYKACLAAGQVACRLGLDVHMFKTPRVIAGFLVLGLFALLPVVVRRIKARQH
jgi:uncharacterized membrane protein YdjX (TVP38/TMEM64 family)